MNEKINDEDELLLKGIDINDKEQNKKIEKQREIQKKNQQLLEGCQAGRNIKELNDHLGNIQREIFVVEEEIGKRLQDKRNKILKHLDTRVQDTKEQLRREAEKKKDNQYDFKQKEKELNEHLETMTQVA